MKLPAISKSNRSTDLENIGSLKEAFNPFLSHLEKVIEVRIFLKFTFHKTDIDDEFIKDLEDEYAVQYLTKMEYLPTKEYKNKLLSLRPIEQSDFHLSVETIREKTVKVIHIYPNGKNTLDSSLDKKEKIKAFLSNEEFQKEMQKNQLNAQMKKRKEDEVVNIQSRSLKQDELMLFNREIVDNLFTKAKDNIIDKQLYAQSNGMRINMSIESIREKYLSPNSKAMLENSSENKVKNAKGKFYHIDKAKKRNILEEKKFQFSLLDVSKLNEEIIEEVMEPIEVPIEIIMKDVNYILDNFPIEDLIDLEEKKKLTNKSEELTLSLLKSSKSLYHKIQSVTKSEIITVYKHMQNINIYRLIGLCLNLVYWVVFGHINRIQIDISTKQFLYIKLLKELQNVQYSFQNKKLLNKIFIPLLILVVRIECENVFNRKFAKLFDDESSRKTALEKANELITSIFDPHCYYNTFTIIGGNAGLLKHKFNKSILPKYKEKTFATSNLLEQIFIIPEEEVNKRYNHRNQSMIGVETEQKMNFIMNEKVDFISDLLSRVNKNLKKRNLEPIFTIRKSDDSNVLKKKQTMTQELENERYYGNVKLQTAEDATNKLF